MPYSSFPNPNSTISINVYSTFKKKLNLHCKFGKFRRKERNPRYCEGCGREGQKDPDHIRRGHDSVLRCLHAHSDVDTQNKQNKGEQLEEKGM